MRYCLIIVDEPKYPHVIKEGNTMIEFIGIRQITLCKQFCGIRYNEIINYSSIRNLKDNEDENIRKWYTNELMRNADKDVVIRK